jgi:ribosomal protein S18 acetylase RimI-like enzyme
MADCATISDLPALHALVEAAYRGDSARRGWTHEADMLGGQRTDAAALREILADPASAILLHHVGSRLVGCVHIRDLGGGLGYLGMLAVDPDVQAGGLGKALLQAGEEEAQRRWRAQRMEMTVIAQRRDLIAWYQRRGWHPTGERRPFPYDDPRFGLPLRDDLLFMVLAKEIF